MAWSICLFMAPPKKFIADVVEVCLLDKWVIGLSLCRFACLTSG